MTSEDREKWEKEHDRVADEVALVAKAGRDALKIVGPAYHASTVVVCYLVGMSREQFMEASAHLWDHLTAKVEAMRADRLPVDESSGRG